eukprot:768524-Hanusia_phi.AAC.2
MLIPHSGVANSHEDAETEDGRAVEMQKDKTRWEGVGNIHGPWPKKLRGMTLHGSFRCFVLFFACYLILSLMATFAFFFKNVDNFGLHLMFASDHCPRLIPSKRILLSSILRNAEPVFPAWRKSVVGLAECVKRRGGELVVSVWSDKNTDDITAPELQKLSEQLKTMGVKHVVEHDGKMPGKYSGANRIERLSWARNQALEQVGLDLLDQLDAIIFVNDVLWTVKDAMKLLHQQRKEGFDALCGLDYMYNFYDTWVSRTDKLGSFAGFYPWVHGSDASSSSLFAAIRSKTFRVGSCWNGIFVANAVPFSSKHKVRFRTGHSFYNGVLLVNSPLSDHTTIAGELLHFNARQSSPLAGPRMYPPAAQGQDSEAVLWEGNMARCLVAHNASELHFSEADLQGKVTRSGPHAPAVFSGLIMNHQPIRYEDIRWPECEPSSESLLFAVDFHKLGFSKMAVNPSVRVFYSSRYVVFSFLLVYPAEWMLSVYWHVVEFAGLTPRRKPWELPYANKTLSSTTCIEPGKDSQALVSGSSREETSDLTIPEAPVDPAGLEAGERPGDCTLIDRLEATWIYALALSETSSDCNHIAIAAECQVGLQGSDDHPELRVIQPGNFLFTV